MSLPPPKSEDEDDKASLLSADFDHVELAPKLERSRKGDPESNGFLSAPPLSGPIRPHSPDTLSILSEDEYRQIQPGRVPRPAVSLASNVPQSRRERFHAFWIHNLGLGYMLLAQFFGTLMNVTVRLVEVEGNNGKGFHPMQILFARMGITLMLSSTYMWWRKTPHFPLGAPEVRWLLVTRGLFGFFGVYGMYASVLYLPLTDATVLTFLAPGLACWACSILIKEPFTRVEQIGGLVSLAGVVLIARPASLFSGAGSATPASGTSDKISGGNGTASATSDASNYDSVTPMQRLFAVGIAMLGVLGAAGAYTTIRWIGQRAHPLISVNYFAAWSTCVAIFGMTVYPGVGFMLPSTAKDWGYLIFLGTSGFIMQFLLATALAYEKSSRTTNMVYTQMLFALGADGLIFGNTPGLLSILGSSLILGSAIVVAVQKSSVSPVAKSEPQDQESQTGLMVDQEQAVNGMHMQEVQMRTLR